MLRIFHLTLLCGHELVVMSLSPKKYYCVECAKLQLRDKSIVAESIVIREEPLITLKAGDYV